MVRSGQYKALHFSCCYTFIYNTGLFNRHAAYASDRQLDSTLSLSPISSQPLWPASQTASQTNSDAPRQMGGETLYLAISPTVMNIHMKQFNLSLCVGAVGMFLFFFWLLLVYEKPSVHPRISTEECKMIESKQGEAAIFYEV